MLSPYILWATEAMKKEIRAGECEGADASESCSEIVGDQNEGHMGKNPGDVPESVNCWRTCWSQPLCHPGGIIPVAIPSFREQTHHMGMLYLHLIISKGVNGAILKL